ncbi:baseplate wedge subunit [Klebsiella phage CPRSB]|nr:baseplate wedge subunit [Klebsiella phage CPRSB]
MNVLIDLLSYATLYIQQMGNTALFESFIRTAALRSSVVQSAQELGYMPDSRTAASTAVMITAANPLNPNINPYPARYKIHRYCKEYRQLFFCCIG